MEPAPRIFLLLQSCSTGNLLPKYLESVGIVSCITNYQRSITQVLPSAAKTCNFCRSAYILHTTINLKNLSQQFQGHRNPFQILLLARPPQIQLHTQKFPIHSSRQTLHFLHLLLCKIYWCTHAGSLLPENTLHLRTPFLSNHNRNTGLDNSCLLSCNLRQ